MVNVPFKIKSSIAKFCALEPLLTADITMVTVPVKLSGVFCVTAIPGQAFNTLALL